MFITYRETLGDLGYQLSADSEADLINDFKKFKSYVFFNAGLIVTILSAFQEGDFYVKSEYDQNPLKYPKTNYP